jgi:hypothetical protein
MVPEYTEGGVCFFRATCLCICRPSIDESLMAEISDWLLLFEFVLVNNDDFLPVRCGDKNRGVLPISVRFLLDVFFPDRNLLSRIFKGFFCFLVWLCFPCDTGVYFLRGISIHVKEDLDM